MKDSKLSISKIDLTIHNCTDKKKCHRDQEEEEDGEEDGASICVALEISQVGYLSSNLHVCIPFADACVVALVFRFMFMTYLPLSLFCCHRKNIEEAFLC